MPAKAAAMIGCAKHHFWVCLHVALRVIGEAHCGDQVGERGEIAHPRIKVALRHERVTAVAARDLQARWLGPWLEHGLEGR